MRKPTCDLNRKMNQFGCGIHQRARTNRSQRRFATKQVKSSAPTGERKPMLTASESMLVTMRCFCLAMSCPIKPHPCHYSHGAVTTRCGGAPQYCVVSAVLLVPLRRNAMSCLAMSCPFKLHHGRYSQSAARVLKTRCGGTPQPRKCQWRET